MGIKTAGLARACRCASAKAVLELRRRSYQTATFKGGPGGQYDYTRSGNPTRSFLGALLR